MYLVQKGNHRDEPCSVGMWSQDKHGLNECREKYGLNVVSRQVWTERVSRQVRTERSVETSLD
jgi:hypothetical protein